VGLFEERLCRRFDRAVSQKRVGRRHLVRRKRRNQNSYQLNEHGPALNVFWSRWKRDGHQVNRKKDEEKDGEAFKKKTFPIGR